MHSALPPPQSHARCPQCNSDNWQYKRNYRGDADMSHLKDCMERYRRHWYVCHNDEYDKFYETYPGLYQANRDLIIWACGSVDLKTIGPKITEFAPLGPL